jgi:hypothetical protein
MNETLTVTDAEITARKLSNGGSRYTYRDGTAQMECAPAGTDGNGGGTFLVFRDGKVYRAVVTETDLGNDTENEDD